jgi:hypothetical protein
VVDICIPDIPQVRPEPAKEPVYALKNSTKLKWSPPKDCTAIKGPITGYTVTLTALSPWFNTTLPEPTVQVSEDKHYATCENLIPYTEYRVSVFVKGPNGETNPALPYSVNFKTLPDGECQKVK